MNNKIKAFSIVELSISIVIIGLLIAGILIATNVNNNAKLKTTITSANDIVLATRNFETIYKNYPGDINNFSSYFSGESNGNGDGQIAAETSNEAFLALRHLNKTGVLKQFFTGSWNGGFAMNQNILSLARDGAGLYIRCCSDTDFVRNLDFNNHVAIFSIDSSDNSLRAGIFTPIEARSIDEKFDDGVPDDGLLGASGNYDTDAYKKDSCYSGTGDSSTYLVNKIENSCQILMAVDW